jgi:hypothetical protein
MQTLAALLLAFLPAASGPASLAQEVVATIAVDAPGFSPFVLQATLPVPTGTHPRPDGLVGLAILDGAGAPLQTQLDAVSRYPRPEDGADVVEIAASVDAPP